MQSQRQRQQFQTRIYSVEDVAEGMRELQLSGPSPSAFYAGPGSHVVVRVPHGETHARRVYSVWWHSPMNTRLALRVATHDARSPGCRWALEASRGDQVVIEAPRRKITVDRSAPFHFFAGEETASVCLLAMYTALYRKCGTGAPPVYGLFEAAGPSYEVPGFAGVPPLSWVHRGGRSAAASPVLLEAVRELSLPAEPGTAYIAGESATCQSLARHLIQERGWPRRAVKLQVHWAPGRVGFGAGQDEPPSVSRNTRRARR